MATLYLLSKAASISEVAWEISDLHEYRVGSQRYNIRKQDVCATFSSSIFVKNSAIH